MALVVKKLYKDYLWLGTLADPRVEGLILAGSPAKLFLLIGVYVLSVKYLLPKYMEKRKPFNLRNIIIVYNILQIVINAYFVYKLYFKLFTMSSWACAEVDYSTSPEGLDTLQLGYSVFWLKMFDLLDTVFYVLKKNYRQVSFLHVYHHSAVIALLWIGVTYLPGGHSIWIPLVNCAVHVLMFTYYLLSAYDNKWKNSFTLKRTMTQIQMIQFMFFVFIYSAVFFVPSCRFPKIPCYLVVIQNVYFLFLFGDFYLKTYVYTKEKSQIN